MRRIAVRGDFLLYVMSGVFMFMTHIKAIGAVSGADGPTSQMMMHAPMNPIISIVGAALSSLYQQVLSAAAVILFIYHAIVTPITIDEPVGMLGMFLLSWFSGVGIGMVLLSAKPWQPEADRQSSTSIYQRVNMIASGKMIAGQQRQARNAGDGSTGTRCSTPSTRARGFMFLNYQPRYTVDRAIRSTSRWSA